MRVSVALCTFNGERYIKEQLESIANQARVPDELIILDDRSEDATVEIAEAVCGRARLDAAIEVNERRLGPDANFSRALGRTSGDVVFFCDQDDVWMPERVEKMIRPFVEDDDVTLVYSNGYITTASLEHSGMTVFEHGGGKKALRLGDERDVGRWLRQGRNPGVKASAAAFRARVRDLASPIPDDVEHDAWVAYLGYASGRVVALSEPLYLYRRHSLTHGASSTNRKVGEGRVRGDGGRYGATVVQRAHLAKCLQQRMQAAQSGAGERFDRFRRAAARAARDLDARARLIGARAPGRRLQRAAAAWMAGAYGAFPGYRARARCLRKDFASRA